MSPDPSPASLERLRARRLVERVLKFIDYDTDGNWWCDMPKAEAAVKDGLREAAEALQAAPLPVVEGREPSAWTEFGDGHDYSRTGKHDPLNCRFCLRVDMGRLRWRSELLTWVQQQLRTDLSDAGTAEAAIEERLTALRAAPLPPEGTLRELVREMRACDVPGREVWFRSTTRHWADRIDEILSSPVVQAAPLGTPPNPTLTDEQREEAIERGMWYRHDGRTFLCIEVEPGADLSCKATRRDALQAAALSLAMTEDVIEIDEDGNVRALSEKAALDLAALRRGSLASSSPVSDPPVVPGEEKEIK